jgi:hypothetical protein
MLTSRELCRKAAAKAAETTARVRRALDGLDDEAFNRRTAAGDWSPAEVLEHIVISHQVYLDRMQVAMAGGPKGGDRPVRFSFIGRFLMKAAGPNGNAPAPKSMVPRPGPYTREVVERFEEQQRAMADLATACDDLDTSAMGYRNPIFKLFKMNVADGFGIYIEHVERHVRQIEERARG